MTVGISSSSSSGMSSPKLKADELVNYGQLLSSMTPAEQRHAVATGTLIDLMIEMERLGGTTPNTPVSVYRGMLSNSATGIQK